MPRFGAEGHSGALGTSHPPGCPAQDRVPKAVSGVKFQKIDHFVYPAQARQQVAEIFSGMEGKSQTLKGPLIFQCKGFGVCVPSAFIDIAKHPSGDAVLQAGHVDADKIAVNAGIAARIP